MSNPASNGAALPEAKPPPHSLESERAALGGLIQGAPWVDFLTGDDFYLPAHRTVFAALLAVRNSGRPIANSTLEAVLQEMGTLQDVGGLAFIGELGKHETCSPIDHDAEILRDHAVRRHALALAHQLVQAVDVDRKLTPATSLVERILRSGNELSARLPMRPTTSLKLEPVSAWSSLPSPPARDWVVEGLIPARRVSTLMANGGTGKSTLAIQLGVHVSVGRPLFGLEVRGGPVLGVFCEDEQDELQRRVRAACAAEHLALAEVDQFIAISREGEENLLCTFEHDQMMLTGFFSELEGALAVFRPRLLILDTLADFFAGDFMSTTHVRQFIKTALGGLCVRHDCSILLIAHPSASGIASGEGAGFSTAWNNSVRSRLYLKHSPGNDAGQIGDKRILEVKKSNYGPAGGCVCLQWERGAFVLDPDPAAEVSPRQAAKKPPRADTGMGMAVMHHFEEKAAAGQVVTFSSLFETLQKHGLIPKGGDYETDRKPLQRTLKILISDGLLIGSKVPRGYRIAPKPTSAQPDQE